MHRRHRKADEILSNLDDNDTSKKSKTKKSKRRRSLTPEWLHRSTESFSRAGMNHFVDTKIGEYLQCDIQPWQYPKHSTEKIELEQIPSLFLPTFSSTAPIFHPISKANGDIEYVRKVCGHRELFMKRTHAKYLKEKENEDVFKLLYPKLSYCDVPTDNAAIEFEIRQRFGYLAPGGGERGRRDDDRRKPRRSKTRIQDERRRKEREQQEKYEDQQKRRKKKYDDHHHQHRHRDEPYKSHRTARDEEERGQVRHGHKERRHRESHMVQKTEEKFKTEHRRNRDTGKTTNTKARRPHHEDSEVFERLKNWIKEQEGSNKRRTAKNKIEQDKGQSQKTTIKGVRKDTKIHPERVGDKTDSKSKTHPNPTRNEAGKARNDSKNVMSKGSKEEPPKTSSVDNLVRNLQEQFIKLKKKIIPDKQQTTAVIAKPPPLKENTKRVSYYEDQRQKPISRPKPQLIETRPRLTPTQPQVIAAPRPLKAPKQQVLPKTASDILNNNELLISQEVTVVEALNHLGQSESKSSAISMSEILWRQALQIRKKLESWIKLEGQKRQQLSAAEPDENANYIADIEDEYILRTEKSGLSQRQSHTAIPIEDEQTVDRIAAHFRSVQVPVFNVNVPHKPNQAQKTLTTTASKNPAGVGGKAKVVGQPAARGLFDNRAKLVVDTNKRVPAPKGNKAVSQFARSLKEGQLDITSFDSYYRYIYGLDVKDLPDRDSEWLELSVTDEDEEDEKIQTFDKPVAKWMHKNLSFESQKLVSDLTPFYWICLLSGRQFYYVTPDFGKGHMEFATNRTRMIPFFVSTFILWAVVVINFSSYFIIKFENVEQKDPDKQLNAEEQALLLEKLEIDKYSETILFIMANLSFVAVWSVMVILRDGQLIVHYLNCWCPALAEMETSAAVALRKITIYNLVAWIVTSGIIILAFCLSFPGNVRGACGLFSMLMFKPIIPKMRLIDEKIYTYCEIFALCFILYIFFCARMLFTLMQLVALIIKNAAEMWNFKFALAFNQLMLSNRGHLQRLSLRVPYVKFFTHHRILTALVKIYGETFGVPIMIYLLVQVGMMTYILVNLFNFKAGNEQDYNGQREVTYEYYERTNNKLLKKVVRIPFYHRPVEEITMSVFVFVMVIFDFMFTTEVLSSASQSFLDGFEFVRRTNLILCKSTHQRRVVQSLLWSMSSTDTTLLSASSYFSISRATIFSGLGTAVFFFSLIIQLQTARKKFFISFKLCTEFASETLEKTELRCKPYREALDQGIINP